MRELLCPRLPLIVGHMNIINMPCSLPPSSEYQKEVERDDKDSFVNDVNNIRHPYTVFISDFAQARRSCSVLRRNDECGGRYTCRLVTCASSPLRGQPRKIQLTGARWNQVGTYSRNVLRKNKLSIWHPHLSTNSQCETP